MTGQVLSWVHDGPVLEIALHRAPCNEIGTTTLTELEHLAKYVRSGAGGARAMLFHSHQPGFCAGADLRELHEGLMARADRLTRVTQRAPRLDRPLRRLAKPLIRRRIRAFLDRIHGVFDTLDMAPLPTVAAINGVCFGGGFELALICDLRVADKSARFSFPELRLGLIPGFGGLPRLRREVSGSAVLDLLLSGRTLGARRAYALGLVHQLVGRGQALEAARRLALQTARYDRAATAAAKAFAKPLPRAELDEEKRTFLSMVTRPEVLASLGRFVQSEGLRPYLP